MSQRLLIADFLSGRFTTVKLRPRQPDCRACGTQPEVTLEGLPSFDYAAFAGQNYDDRWLLPQGSLRGAVTGGAFRLTAARESLELVLPLAGVRARSGCCPRSSACRHRGWLQNWHRASASSTSGPTCSSKPPTSQVAPELTVARQQGRLPSPQQ